MATIGALASVVLLFLNARPVVSDERSEEFRRSVKESLSGPVQANRSDGIKPEIGIERKNYTYHYFCCWRTAREKALRRMMAYAVQTEMPVITQEIG